jgi:hypothetical protein
MTPQEVVHLADLRGFREAPPLSSVQRCQLREELRQRVASCQWCTIGVMAPGAVDAWAALQSFAQALDLPPFAAPSGVEESTGPVFLKANQRNGQVWLRQEAGLGQGVLLTGHSASNPELEDTWGPLPLDLFATVSAAEAER